MKTESTEACHHLLKSTWKNSLTQICIYTNSVYGPVYPIALISVNYITISPTPTPPPRTLTRPSSAVEAGQLVIIA